LDGIINMKCLAKVICILASKTKFIILNFIRGYNFRTEKSKGKGEVGKGSREQKYR
jgi:hypothetical protein